MARNSLRAWALLALAAGDAGMVFVRDAGGLLHGPYAADRQELARHGQVVRLDAAAVPVAAVASQRAAGGWFLRCPDGELRGPYDAQAIARWVAEKKIPAELAAFAERPSAPGPDGPPARLGAQPADGDAADGAAPAASGGKSSWKKHLRVHRWRATRTALRYTKGAVATSVATSVQAATSLVVKSWDDEELEWTKVVAAAHATAAARREEAAKAAAANPPRQPLQGRAAAQAPRVLVFGEGGQAHRLVGYKFVAQAADGDAWRQHNREAIVARARGVAVSALLAALVAALIALFAKHFDELLNMLQSIDDGADRAPRVAAALRSYVDAAAVASRHAADAVSAALPPLLHRLRRTAVAAAAAAHGLQPVAAVAAESAAGAVADAITAAAAGVADAAAGAAAGVADAAAGAVN
ncbi:hypothetical protein M885DRAFT_519462 [Pelagophyceae sp. CCMP2097]|nr:hypothetical protein M885DRAFT_519462 [Pelagophyceae sp. CCMP2097]